MVLRVVSSTRSKEECLVHRAIGGLAATLMVFAAACGQGRSGPEIEGVYHHWNWMMMLNAGMIDTGADYILFKDGEVWRHPQLPPQDLDIAKAKQVASADWGSWQRSGRVVVIRMPGGHDERYDSTQLIRYEAAPKNQRVEGSWQTTLSQVSNAGGLSTAGVVTNTLVLHADGRFEWESSSGASFQNETGSARSGGTYSSSRPVRAGHYLIDGYSLELRYEDGRVERDLFYWAGGEGNKRYDMVVVSGRKYLGALKH